MSATPPDDALDAARWRALLSSARIRIVGTAGFGHSDRPADPTGYRHFGAEFWSHHNAPPEAWNGALVLTEYADAIIARNKAGGPR